MGNSTTDFKAAISRLCSLSPASTFLIAMVECKSCNMQDRNHAVWTLGQLDDPRALPTLEKCYTGAKCDHLKNLCQDTLQIALRHLRHEDNNRFEAALWRWVVPAENGRFLIRLYSQIPETPTFWRLTKATSTGHAGV